MISTDKVLSMAEQLYGIGTDGKNRRVLCSLVCSEIQPLLRDDADENDIRILILCAAKLNLRLVTLNSEDEGITAFEAGDVSVSVTPLASAERAEKGYGNALISASPLLRDEGFLFRQVRV